MNELTVTKDNAAELATGAQALAESRADVLVVSLPAGPPAGGVRSPLFDAEHAQVKPGLEELRTYLN